MRLTPALLARRQPLIRFLGKHSPPAKVDHTPHAHPAAPESFSLPETFASYRQKAQQHGPLGKKHNTFTSIPFDPSAAGAGAGVIGGQAGAALGSVQPTRTGVFFDRTELEPRFWRSVGWTPDEIEAVESGGASLVA